MIGEWLRKHRSALATATSGTVIVGLITTFAVVSGGYSAQRMDLGDGSVWVTNEDRQAIGRANTEVLELNSVLESANSQLSVVQSGRTVLLVDEEAASLEIVDPVTSTIVDTVAIPPAEPSVTLAGSRVVLASAGNIWAVPVDTLADFDGASEPDLTLGLDSVTSTDPAGRLFAYTPSTGTVSFVDAAAGERVSTTWQAEAGAPDDEFQITSVAGHFVVLDVDSLRLTFEGRSVDLSGVIDAGATPVLQRASSDGDRVFIAHRGGLISVGLTGGNPMLLVDDTDAVPAAPVRVGGCTYAAWAEGSAWRRCDGGTATTSVVPGMSGTPALEFQSNGEAIVLNDVNTGRSWAVTQGNALIDNWDQLIDSDRDEDTVEINDENDPPTLERTQEPPVAVDDEFGARPGRASTLPVLLNDYDANGDVLVIADIEPLQDTGARVDLISSNQQMQLTLPDDATGSLSFRYTIDDGRGGTASAIVTVAVRSDEENSPPKQVRASSASVEIASRVTTEVLGDWVDPDGDPMFLASAVTQEPDLVTYTPDGRIVFTEAGGPGPDRRVGLQVSDGRDVGAGVLEVAVQAQGSVALIAEPFVELAYAGEEIRVSPLQHVRGGSGDVRLTAVPTKPDASITPDFDRGTFRFSSTAIRTHYLEYTVADGNQTATGIVRVDVSAPPDIDIRPITVPHTAFLRVQQPGDVDVLATDIDPSGGVLLVTGVDNVAPESGLRVEIIEQRMLRVTLTRPLESGPVTFDYRVSNGLAEAEGSVTVIEIPVPAHAQAPVATNDVVSVRVGDVIDIPVLDNDNHPDGDALSLAADLPTNLPDGAGLLFAAGNRLRYLAPSEPGNFTATYRVDAPDGQFATATVKIAVREVDPDTNAPPVPVTVTARALAGDTVRIRIPLGGIDPDGDSVQLLGQETAPERGIVVASGQNWIDYEAGEYSAGTDTFEYAVVDALGARASGTIRVGIAARLDGGRNPVAVEDSVLTRPGGTVAVQVLENDSDPDGGVLSVTAVEPTTEGATAEIDGDVIEVTVPDREGRFGFIYEIQNQRGGSGSTFLTVEARTDAPLARPKASDVVLSLSDVLERQSIDVDVLANVFFADGDPDELGVGIVPGYDATATVLADKRIRVVIADSRQIIPFRVSHPEDPSITATAFIWVPGFDDALPQLRRDARRINVPSEQTIEIEINDYIVATGGRSVRITDAATVRASHSDGSDLVVDSDTIRFRSAQGYYGPASISFTVTDGASAADPDARSATIVLPITVTPRENQPPALIGGLIEFEPGQAKTIDLVRLTNYPYPNDHDELVYRMLYPLPDGFDVALAGQKLTITAHEATRNGTTEALTLGVRDEVNEGSPGRIDLRVVPSTKPIAQPAPDVQIAPRGETTIVDVLANDAPGNPFPQTPLRVIAVRGIDTALPSGVSITPSADNASLTVRVSNDAVPGNTTLQYQVADATRDSSRYAWGTVTISVQDRPDPVSDLRITGFGDRRLSTEFLPGSFNNSPITGYEVSLLDSVSGEVVGSTICVATTCDLATPGNGEAHAVIVRVSARNAIGLSDPVDAPSAVWSDVVPESPAGLSAAPLNGGLTISWAPVGATGGGTAVRSYVVTVAGESAEVSAASACTASRCSVERGGLVNGSQVPFTVSARNEAYPALSVWNESGGTGVPFGPPSAGGIEAIPNAEAGSVTVAWDQFDPNGDAVLGYYVQRLTGGTTAVPGGAQACTVSGPAPGEVNAPANGGSVEQTLFAEPGASSATFTGLTDESRSYSFVVWGFNRSACVSTGVAQLGDVRPAPSKQQADAEMRRSGDTVDLAITGVSPFMFRNEIVRVDASGAQVGAVRAFSGTGWAREVLGVQFGETARLQVRGCTIWGSCGAWSDIVTSPEPTITLAVNGLRWSAGESRWTWASDPANRGIAASYVCGVAGQAGVPADGPLSCTIPNAASGSAVWIEVTVNGHVQRYDN